MEMIRFENPQYFYLLALIPVFVLIFFISRLIRRRALKRLAQADLLDKIMPNTSGARPWLRFFIIMLAFASVTMAAVNPKVGSRIGGQTQQGVEMIVALDVSRSMLAEDVRPNRLERSKMAISRLIDNLQDDRIGVVLFAGSSITQVPITNDKTAAKMLLRTVNTNSVSVQGTAIGSAIHRAMASFDSEDLTNRILIIVSDGENHMDDPVEAARIAAQRGLIIHTIGIGTTQGAPIPLYHNNQMTGFLRDRQGNTVVSRYDEETLRRIAQVTGGTFQHGAGADLGLGRILEEIRNTEKTEFDRMVFSEYQSRFHYFVALAVLLLVMEIFILERKNKWLQKIRLFD
jgi:Ca-activated chloride channel homolog